ncbi:hypothetical protein PMAYCL1PPCAC_21119, partial [Pristionchus mayeri]
KMLLLALAAAAAAATAANSSQEEVFYTLGAVLREKEDSHIAAALEFSVKMQNDNEKVAPRVNLHIEFIKPDDHYGAIRKACSLVEEHSVVAVVGPSDTYLNNQLARTLGQLDIPLVTVNDDFRLDTHEGHLQFFPRLQLFDAVNDMFKYWKWQRITIVYEDDARIRRIKAILESDQFKNTRFILIRVLDKDYMKAAKEVKESEECKYLHKKDCAEFNRVLVDLSPEQTFNFLLAALRMGLIELKHWFVFTNLELSSIDMDLFRHNHARFISPNPVDLNFEKTHGNRTTFSMKGFHQYVLNAWNQKTNGNLDFKLMEAVFAFDAVRAFAKAQKHIPPVSFVPPIATCRRPARPARPFPHGKMVGLLMKNVNEKGLSGDLRRLTGDEKSSNFTMRIQLLGYSGDLEDIGFWNSNVSVDIKPDGRKQLQKNKQVSDELKPHFRVTTIMERPYVMHKTNHYELSHNNKYEGFCIDLLTELSKDLGFTFSIHTVKDGSYGNAKNGTWDGMIGEILRGEAEMAVAPLTVNFKRAEVVDFTKPFLSLGISILFKVPSDQQPDLFSFLNPLSWQIWLCILGAIGGVTLGMFAVARITPYEWNLNFSCCTAHQPHPAASFTPADAPVELSNNYSFFNTLWYVTSTMLKGGCDFGPRAVSTRLLGGTWWVFTLVIISAYTANLAAVLTVSRPFIPIKNLDDLANQTAISYGTIDGGSTMQFFQESRIPAHVKMWDYMNKQRTVNPKFFPSNNGKGVDRVLKENYAFLMESTSLEYEVQQNCNLTQIGGVLGSKGYGIALKRGSEWTDRISRQILLYAKRGIIEMKKTKWWRSKGATCSGAGSAVNDQRLSLSIHNVAGLFIILCAGLIVGVLVVICELIIRSRQLAKAGPGKKMREELSQELRYALNLNKVEEHHSRKKGSNGDKNGDKTPLNGSAH